MEEMIRFYANGKELKLIPVTQNEKGVYYTNGKVLYKPVLALFDNAKLPAGYKKMANGSHKGDVKAKPIDFSLNAGTQITASKQVKINQKIVLSGKKKYWAIEVIYGNIHILLGHVQCPHRVKSRVDAGKVICVINTPKQNLESAGGEWPPHLHAGTYRFNGYENITFREIVLFDHENISCEKKLKLAYEKIDILEKDIERLKVTMQEAIDTLSTALQ